MDQEWFLAIAGFVTGLIDAIAGGGGLISVPSYMLVLGPGTAAVATNKVSAFASTVTALWIYSRKGFVDFHSHKKFFVTVLIGAVAGSFVSPLLPQIFYKIMMVVLIPLILWVLFQRQLWVEPPRRKGSPVLMALLGFGCGVYDGVAGPGGGTLMFLTLFVVGGLPLSLSIGTAKLGNVFSSGSSLVSYVALDQVHWVTAIPATVTIVIGAVIGARYATKNAALYARAALAAVSLFILGRLIYSYYI